MKVYQLISSDDKTPSASLAPFFSLEDIKKRMSYYLRPGGGYEILERDARTGLCSVFLERAEGVQTNGAITMTEGDYTIEKLPSGLRNALRAVEREALGAGSIYKQGESVLVSIRADGTGTATIQ